LNGRALHKCKNNFLIDDTVVSLTVLVDVMTSDSIFPDRGITPIWKKLNPTSIGYDVDAQKNYNPALSSISKHD
jgi:hypothetical protein